MDQYKIKRIMDGFLKLPLRNQICLMLGFAISIGVGFAIANWAESPSMRPLYNANTIKETAKVVDVLELHGIDYRFDINTNTVFVEKWVAGDARLRLAQAGFEVEMPDIEPNPPTKPKAGENPEFWKEGWVLDYVRVGIGFFLISMLIIGVLRPVLMRLAKNSE